MSAPHSCCLPLFQLSTSMDNNVGTRKKATKCKKGTFVMAISPSCNWKFLVIFGILAYDIEHNILFLKQFKVTSLPLLLTGKNLKNIFQFLSWHGKIVELVLLMPATNSTSKRCFSKLRLILTHLRTRMSQKD